MRPIVYPEDIQCVYEETPGSQTAGRIYISNLEAAQNKQTLKKHAVKAVVSVAKGAFLEHSEAELPSYLYIPADDIEHFDLYQYFEKAANFIDRNLPHTNVLVHCLAGVSRSVTLVIAFLMKRLKLNFADAYSIVKSRRPIIHPNKGFVAQLKRHELNLMTDRRSRQKLAMRESGPARLGRARSPPTSLQKPNPEIPSSATNLGAEYYQIRAKQPNRGENESASTLNMRLHHQYLEERIRKLTEGALQRKAGSISPNKVLNPRSATPDTRNQYQYPSSRGALNRFDSYRLKTESTRADNISHLLRSLRN